MCLGDLRQPAHKSGHFPASDQWCDGIDRDWTSQEHMGRVINKLDQSDWHSFNKMSVSLLFTKIYKWIEHYFSLLSKSKY